MGKSDESAKKFSRPGFTFEPGFWIELLETGIWYTCKILQVDWQKSLVLIHYDRWSHKFDEWVPMSSPDIRPCKERKTRHPPKKHFRVREDVFALWGADGRRYPGSIQAVLPNDTYRVVFYDGIVRKLKSSKLSKWTRANEELFGTAHYAREAPTEATPQNSASSASQSLFVAEVLETKRKRKTNPIVEQLLGSKRARRQAQEEQERTARERSPRSGRSSSQHSPAATAPTYRSPALASPTRQGSTRAGRALQSPARTASSQSVPPPAQTSQSPGAAPSLAKTTRSSSTTAPQSPPSGAASGASGGGARKQSWSRLAQDGDTGGEETQSESEASMEEEEEEEDGLEADSADESVYSESVLSLGETTASSSYRSVSPSAVTPAVSSAEPSPAHTPNPPSTASASALTATSPSPSSGAAGDSEEDPTTVGLPAGWRRSLTQRHNSTRLDVVLFAPEGRRFRSRVELERYLQQSGLKLDALAMFRRPDGGLFRRAAGPSVAQPAVHSLRRASAPAAGSARPCFSSSKCPPAPSSTAGPARPSFTAALSHPATAAAAAGYKHVYTGAEALTKKLPLGWALEPIVETPTVEESDLVCVDPDCKKKFRKESLLQMHIKHYHPGLRHLVNTRSLSVAKLAQKRTKQQDLPPPGESTAPPAGEKVRPLRSAEESAAAAGGGRERPPSPPPPPEPPQQEKQREAQLPAGAADDPKLMSEAVVSVRVGVPGLNDSSLHSPVSEAAAASRGFRRPRRRQPTADESEISELIQIVDSSTSGADSPVKTRSAAATGTAAAPTIRRRPESGDLASKRRLESGDLASKRRLESGDLASKRKPEPVEGGGRRKLESGETSDRGDGSRSLHSCMSLEEQLGSPYSPAASSISVRDTDAAGDEDGLSEAGGDKLDPHEVIRCDCGQLEEDGLMIQCELCLSWQHGVCLSISSDSEVPQHYVCDTCRHPWRVRRTQRHVWDQQMYRDGTVMKLPFGPTDGAMERAQAVMRASVDLSANVRALQSVIHSLRAKMAIASDLNHPKLYLWARPWSPPPAAAAAAGSEAGLSCDLDSPAALLAVVTSAEGLLEKAEIPAGEPAVDAAGDAPEVGGVGTGAGGGLKSGSTVTEPKPSGDASTTLTASSVDSGPPQAAETSQPPPPASADDQLTDLDTNPAVGHATPSGSGKTAAVTATASSEERPAASSEEHPTASGKERATASSEERDTASSEERATAASEPPLQRCATEPPVPGPATSGPLSDLAASADLSSAAGDSENLLASLNSDQRALLSASLAAAAGRDDQTALEDHTSAMEEGEDPLKGMLDAIADLLPTQSDLEQLMEGAVPDAAEPPPPPPVAPVGEARIDPETCQQNLWTHVTQMQMALLSRLDSVQTQVEALEKVADVSAGSWAGDQDPARCRHTLQTVVRDVRLVERMAQLS